MKAGGRGPFPAPIGPMTTSPRFESRTVATDSHAIQAIYGVQLPFPHPGHYVLLALTKVGGMLEEAGTQVVVTRASAIPNVGQRPPRIATPTVLSGHGDVAKLDTRSPPAAMPKVGFR